jgi:DNA-binding NtrC family response regulator
MQSQVLIVDDDRVILQGLRDAIKKIGCSVLLAETAQEAASIYESRPVDLVLLDVRLPDGDGIELLRWILERDCDQLVVMMTAYEDASKAVQAMKAGAHDYIHKPFDLEELRILIKRALEVKRLKDEVDVLRKQFAGNLPSHELVGASNAIKRIRQLVQKISQTPRTSVLIQGESGTGKERVANAIHFLSKRRHCPFLRINCSTIPRDLMESELFGYERGAFTDAKSPKRGLLEMANGGTVLLDEIADLHPHLQPKLLRFLETQTFNRVGGLKEISVDVRIVASTNKDLRELVRRGQFREDLYYRLKVMFVEIPPLRERPEDIPLLVRHFLAEIGEELGKKVKGINDDAMESLMLYPWPGNARELRNVLERAMILSESGLIRKEHLKLDVVEGGMAKIDGRRGSENTVFHEDWTLRRVEMEHILRVLKWVGGNKSEAARRLGISRSTLLEKLKAADL